MRTLVVNLERLGVEPDTVGNSLLDGHSFTGVAYEEGPNAGSIVGVYGYHLGKLHGPFRVWHHDGLLKEEEYRAKGALHGPRRTWHRNGQLAESSYTDYRVTTRLKRWDERGAVLESFLVAEDSAVWTKVEAERARGLRAILEIDLKTLSFLERPERWGRDESELPPPQRAPSLELCRALEVTSSR